MIRQELAIVPLLFLAWAAMAPCSRAEDVSDRYLVRVWHSEDGLPSNGVRSVVQAADGWIWAGTAEGLTRFDGVRFTEFAQESDATLAQLPVRALFALPNGDVWVNASRGGLFRWHGGRLREVWPDEDPASPKPTQPSVDEVISDGADGAILVHGSDLWLAKGDAAPRRIERTPAIDALRLKKDAPARDTSGARRELRDGQGRLWQVAGDGLDVTEASGETFHVAMPPMKSPTRIFDLTEDREGNIWAATRDGLAEISPRPVKMLSTADGLAGRAIRAVMEDASGALWVSMRAGGVDRIVSGEVTHYNVDTDGNGREIVAFCEDRSGTIWAAANVGRIYCIRNGKLGLGPFKSPPAPSRITAICEDHQGRLWFAHGLGLSIWDGQTLTSCAVPAQFFSALAVDASGTVWAGTKNGTIFRNRDLTMERVGSVSKSRGISGLLPDADGSLWISTIGGGLHHLVGDRTYGFGPEHGLPDARLTCVLDDAAGRLWLGSLTGISAVSKAELANIERGTRQTAHWVAFDRSDGMLASECVGGPQPAGWRGKDGQLWFATGDGVAHIQPAELWQNRVPPAVALEKVTVNGVIANLGARPVQAGPGRTRIEFTYTGLSFTAPEKIRFRSRLEGLETTWNEMGNERHIAFDSVPAGSYRFRVIAANRDGVWSEQGAAIRLKVLPHFWERTSARIGAGLLAVAAAGGIGWGIARARMKRRLTRIQLQSAREAERARIARDLHDDLGASLTHISLFANMAAERERAGRDTQSVLPEIAIKAQALVGALDEIVWAANPRYDTLASMAEYLAAFASELFADTGIGLRLEMPRDLPTTTLDAERRHSLFLAAREALNNTVKHSGASEVRLRLSLAGGALEIVVEDNGRGFDPSRAGQGEGLRNLHERLARIGGECLIASQPGQGTSVRLVLAINP